MTALRQVDPEWSTQAGDHTADSHAPEVFSIETDTAPYAIIDTPIPLNLSAAKEAGGRVDFFDRIHREPFRGLAEQRPIRALAARTFVARSGEAPSSA